MSKKKPDINSPIREEKRRQILKENELSEALTWTSTTSDPASVVSLGLDGEFQLTPEEEQRILDDLEPEDYEKAGVEMPTRLPWNAEPGKPIDDKAVKRGELLDIEPILALHRMDDGYINFERRGPDGKHEQLFALTPDQLKREFPSIASWLVRDSFFSINATYKAGDVGKRGFAHPLRRKKMLRWLNACYADLDCGRPDSERPEQRLSAPYVMAGLLDMAERGLIPMPSMVALSGRGVYAFWFLVEEAMRDQPVRAWPSRVAFFQQVQRAIGSRLREYAWDTTSTDAVKVLRVPGTLHAKANTPSIYSITPRVPGRELAYTLNEMAKAFDLRLLDHDTSAPVAYTTPKKRNPNKRRGYEAVRRYLANDLEKLEQQTGGWKKGQRKKNMTLYALTLSQSGEPTEDISDRIKRMAKNCIPPYPSETNDTPLKTIIAEAVITKRKGFRRDPLIARFKVTPEMARSLELEYLIPLIVRLERDDAKPTRKQTIETRRRILKAWIEKHDSVPTQRQAQSLLSAKGHDVSIGTVNADYKAINIIRGEGTPGRPLNAIKQA